MKWIGSRDRIPRAPKSPPPQRYRFLRCVNGMRSEVKMTDFHWFATKISKSDIEIYNNSFKYLELKIEQGLEDWVACTLNKTVFATKYSKVLIHLDAFLSEIVIINRNQPLITLLIKLGHFHWHWWWLLFKSVVSHFNLCYLKSSNLWSSENEIAIS